MAVPSSVDSIREQIKEALKLSMADGGICDFIALPYSWGNVEKEQYPVAKAFYSNSTLNTEYLGDLDMRNDTLMVQIAPLSYEDDFELVCSKIVESAPQFMATEKVRSFMDSSYQDGLGKITIQQIETPETDLQMPYAVVNITLDVQYLRAF